MPVRMEEFLRRTASRNWSMTGTTREERKTEETEVFLYGRPLAESRSRNQMRGEGGDDMEEDCCCCGLDDIFTIVVFEKKRNFSCFFSVGNTT